MNSINMAVAEAADAKRDCTGFFCPLYMTKVIYSSIFLHYSREAQSDNINLSKERMQRKGELDE